MIPVTKAAAYAAGLDAGNRSMHQASRTQWNEDDWNAASAVANKLLHIVPQYSYLVTVRYRTTRTCNAWTGTIIANDAFTAIALASDRVRKRRGVMTIDGGEVMGEGIPAP